MCPFYTEGSTAFDAKSELYSFGIVILEVLTGKLQGSSGGSGRKLMLHRSVDSLTADIRAAWPAQCVGRLFDLARQSIAEYHIRIKSTSLVMRELREIKDFFCPVSAAAESVYQQHMSVLIAQKEELCLARDVSIAQSIRKCLVCYDDELLLSDGFECTANKHFVCKKNGCFAQITMDQSGERVRFAANGCKILCTIPECGEVVEDNVVAFYAGKDGFTAFLRAKLAAHEESVVRDYEERLNTLRAEVRREVFAGNSTQAKRLQHRNHIIEELLPIKCPHCLRVFIMDNDFDECFALRCSGCDSNFCGWCLRDFGTADAHDHTAGCRAPDLQPRGLFPHRDNDRMYTAKHCFDQAHGPRRAAAVKAYLDEQGLQGVEMEAVIQAVEEQWNTGSGTLEEENIILREENKEE